MPVGVPRGPVGCEAENNPADGRVGERVGRSRRLLSGDRTVSWPCVLTSHRLFWVHFRWFMASEKEETSGLRHC